MFMILYYNRQLVAEAKLCLQKEEIVTFYVLQLQHRSFAYRTKLD